MENKETDEKKHIDKKDEIYSALIELSFDPEDVERFIEALMENAIPHVSINY